MEDGATKTDLKEAYTDSLRTVWIVCCGISGVALLFSLMTEHYDLDRALETTQGLRQDNVPTEKDVEKGAEARAETVLKETTPWAY
jgi:hypothetical protein